VPRRCIDGGAGIDGCHPSPSLEVGSSDVWLEAIRADRDHSHGLIAAVKLDALRPVFMRDDADDVVVIDRSDGEARSACRTLLAPVPDLDVFTMRGVQRGVGA